MDLKKILKDKKTYYMLLFLAIIAASAVLLVVWVFHPDILPTIAVYLIEVVIMSGVWGFVIYFGVMTAQCILVPIPSELVLLLTGILWGTIGGSFMGFAGSVFTGILAYYVTVRGGRPIAEKLVPKKFLDPLDNLINRYGTWFIFMMRAVPLMAYDPISYASGLLKINFKKYMIATIIGSVPRALFYAFLGQLLMSGINTSTLPPDYHTWNVANWQDFINLDAFKQFSLTFNIIFVLILGIMIGMFLVYNFILNPYLIKKGIKLKQSAKEGSEKGATEQPAVVEPDQGSTKEPDDSKLLEKFKELASISQRIKKSEVAEFLGLKETDLLKKLVAWKRDLPFKIDKDLIVIDNLDAFTSALDAQFEVWGNTEAKKEGKLEGSQSTISENGNDNKKDDAEQS